MNLGYKLENRIEYKGRVYRLDLAFDNVLRVFDVQQEDVFADGSWLPMTLELLAGKRAARLPIPDQMRLWKRINAKFISRGAKPLKPGEPRSLDFTQDAALIYAAFFQAYGIDLNKERGRMDWRVFMALFEGLPDDTRIREVIRIRTRPLPKPNEYNAEEIRSLMEAKAFYAIKVSEEEAEAGLQAGINRLAATLISQTKAGDGHGRCGRQGSI